MGLGKTIQITTFVLGLFAGKMLARVLIITPKSVLDNWKNEIAKWFEIFSFH